MNHKLQTMLFAGILLCNSASAMHPESDSAGAGASASATSAQESLLDALKRMEKENRDAAIPPHAGLLERAIKTVFYSMAMDYDCRMIRDFLSEGIIAIEKAQNTCSEKLPSISQISQADEQLLVCRLALERQSILKNSSEGPCEITIPYSFTSAQKEELNQLQIQLRQKLIPNALHSGQ